MKVSTLAGLPVIVAVSFMFALAAVAYTYYAPTASAQAQTETNEEEAVEESEEGSESEEKSEDDDSESANEEEQAEKEESTDVTYNYVAQPGDSYSKIARKAVQTFGLKNNVKLSPAQIIYAETNLTLEADAPSLNVGEEIAVSEAAVKSWVEKAEDLSDEVEAEWAYYVSRVEFNTDNVGESR